ncbi:MAG: NADPH-dependent FMN reductase [Xanthobacteraceae bacterium]
MSEAHPVPPGDRDLTHAPRHRILAISGSLRDASSNTAALLAAAQLAPATCEVVLFEGLAALPPFNPDLEMNALPGVVADFRRQVGACSALLISSPEYARGIAGTMKNALDWLVGSQEFPGKPVAVINTSQRSHHADAHLRLTLETMSASLVGPASTILPLNGRTLDAGGIVADAELASTLLTVLKSLQDAIGAAS